MHAPHGCGCCGGEGSGGGGGGGGKGERGASGERIEKSLVRVLGFHLFEGFLIFWSFR